MELILASASPRRSALLRQVGLEFQVVPSHVDEAIPEGISPGGLVEYLALSKAKAVAALQPTALVLGADTIVVVDGEILNKPRDRGEAVAMLQRLSGRSHQVMTGVALVSRHEDRCHHEITVVHFQSLDQGQIERYVDSGEPMDKAGAYGIQGRASAMISGIEGDYFNVVGLPLSRTVQMLAHFGVEVL